MPTMSRIISGSYFYNVYLNNWKNRGKLKIPSQSTSDIVTAVIISLLNTTNHLEQRSLLHGHDSTCLHHILLTAHCPINTTQDRFIANIPISTRSITKWESTILFPSKESLSFWKHNQRTESHHTKKVLFLIVDYVEISVCF